MHIVFGITAGVMALEIAADHRFQLGYRVLAPVFSRNLKKLRSPQSATLPQMKMSSS